MILEWTREARLRVAGLLDDLTDDEWRAPSLCAGWTVRHVAAHLTMSTRTTWRVVLREALRAKGNFDRMEDTVARERAPRFTPGELVAQLRETAGSSRRTPGAGLADALVDALVHAQDIARPLGRTAPMPAEHAAAALEHVLGSNFYGAKRRFAGKRLVATDHDWSAGTGEEVRGPIGDLLVVATGRPAGLSALTGALPRL